MAPSAAPPPPPGTGSAQQAQKPKISAYKGVKVPGNMFLEGPLKWDSTRRNMTASDRKYREQWLADRRLAPHEPDLAAYLKLRYQYMNPIRRALAAPADWLALKLLVPLMGPYRAGQTRYAIPRMLLFGIIPAYAIAYYFTYNAFHHWEEWNGWRKYRTRPEVYPGDPHFGEEAGGYTVKDKREWSNHGQFLYRSVYTSLPLEGGPSSTPVSGEDPWVNTT